MKQAYQGVSPGIEAVCAAYALHPVLSALQQALIAHDNEALRVLHVASARWFIADDTAGLDIAAVTDCGHPLLLALRKAQQLQVLDVHAVDVQGADVQIEHVAHASQQQGALLAVESVSGALLLRDTFALLDGKYLLRRRCLHPLRDDARSTAE